MTGAILIGSLTFCLASTVHYFALTRLYGVITARLKPGYWAMLAGICGAGAAHLIEAMLYAFGFAVMDTTGLGGFKGGDSDGFMDIFYFSPREPRRPVTIRNVSVSCSNVRAPFSSSLRRSRTKSTPVGFVG